MNENHASYYRGPPTVPRHPLAASCNTPRAGQRRHAETLFGQGNGDLGIQGAHWAVPDADLPGGFINGLHEIRDIKLSETAFGFARTRQRTIYILEASNFTVVIDGEMRGEAPGL